MTPKVYKPVPDGSKVKDCLLPLVSIDLKRLGFGEECRLRNLWPRRFGQSVGYSLLVSRVNISVFARL